MRQFLLDSHVVIAFSLNQIAQIYPRFATLLAEPTSSSHVSTASLWEIAIKVRLGKLRLGGDIRALPDLLRGAGVEILTVSERHATADLAVEPDTRDPFDRMLLAQCQVEAMRLVTADRALAGHPLAWRDA